MCVTGGVETRSISALPPVKIENLKLYPLENVFSTRTRARTLENQRIHPAVASLPRVNQVPKFQRDTVVKMVRLSLGHRSKGSGVSSFMVDTPYLIL